MDPVEQVIARVCVCIIGTLITALAQFPLSSLDRHIKEWRQRELPILQPLLCISGLY